MRSPVMSFVGLPLMILLQTGLYLPCAQATCIDYAGFPQEIASIEVPGEAKDIVVDGTRAYVAAGIAGFQIIDVADPAEMVVLGNVPIPGLACGVAVSGTHAYVAGGDSGLVVIDVTGAPAITGRLALPGTASKVAVSGGFAYVAAGGAGLHVLDISDPHAPQLLGTVGNPESGYAGDVEVDGRYAYVGDGWRGLLVVDVLLPESPQVVGQLDTPGYARGVSLSGSVICLAGGWESGLCLIDVSNPLSPVLRGLAASEAEFVAVTARDGYAYVSANYSGFFIYDISDPTAPFVTNYVEVGTMTLGAAVDGTIAYLACSLWSVDAGAIRTIDVTTPGSPTLGRCVIPGSASALVLHGDVAYVASDGLRVVDLSDPSHPQIIGGVYLPGWNRHIALAGNYACMAITAALRVIDITDPTSPQLRGSFDPPGSVWGVDARGTYAFLATADDSDGYLRVVDISDPDHPAEVAALRVARSASCVTLDGSYAYVGTRNPGLYVVDISDPLHPFVCGSTGEVYRAHDIVVAGGYAYVTEETGPLQILDVSIPSAPHVVQEIWPAGGAGVDVANGIVYFGQYDGQFCAADVSDPLSPRFLGYFMTPDMVSGVWAGTGYLCLAAGAYGLVVVPFQCGPSGVPGAGWCRSGPRITATPNPSRADSEVRLCWPVQQERRIRIIDPAGRLVRELVAPVGTGSGLESCWDGRDSHGRVVAPGVYLVEGSAAGLKSATRMVRVR